MGPCRVGESAVRRDSPCGANWRAGVGALLEGAGRACVMIGRFYRVACRVPSRQQTRWLPWFALRGHARRRALPASAVKPLRPQGSCAATFLVERTQATKGNLSSASAYRHPEDSAHRFRSDRDWSGLRVRLLRDAGLQGLARGGVRGRAGEFEPGDDHDRPRHRRPDLYRAVDLGDRGQGDRGPSGRTPSCRPWEAKPP